MAYVAIPLVLCVLVFGPLFVVSHMKDRDELPPDDEN